MKFKKNESGQVLVLTALSMSALLGFVGLATDVGVLFRVRHNLQIAADAAATTAALYQSYGLSAAAAANMAAGENGVTNGVDGANVITNAPPVIGPATGRAGFAEVVVAKPTGTIFMSVFGFRNIAVTARAVAGPVAGNACIYLMNKSGTDLSLQGSGTIEAPGGQITCAVFSNSTSSSSVSVNGQGNYINAAYIGTMGGLSAAGNSNTSPTPVTTGVYQQQPPNSLMITAPTSSKFSSCPPATGTTAKVNSTNYTTLTSNDLKNGMANNGLCFSGNVMLQGTASSPLNLPSGLYVFAGQVAIGNYVTANGVTLDIVGDGGPATENILTVTSTTNVNLRAQSASDSSTPCVPTGGAFCDVLLLAPSTNNQTFNIQWGSSGGSANSCQSLSATTAAGLGFSGIIDAPSANISLQDQGGYAMVAGMVVGSLTLKTGLLCINNYAAANPLSRLAHITLVE